ncbi:5176_t:CDS:1, partial [Funneliformis caledonium]
LFAFIAFTTAISIKDESIKLEKRNSCSSNSKRNLLGKRNEEDKSCPCTIAESIFYTEFRGFTFYSQDECGSTTIAGMFSRGFETLNSTNNITFEIVDSCNRTLYDLTEGLNVQINDDGSTDPYLYTFDEITLDCFEDGILFPQVGKYSKRTCGSNQRRDGDNSMVVKQNDDIQASAKIENVPR